MKIKMADQVEDLSYTFLIVIGDYWADGHGRYETLIYNTNKPVEVVQEAANKANELIPGFTAMFSGYRETTIHQEQLDSILKVAPAAKEIFVEDDDEKWMLEENISSYAVLLGLVLEACGKDLIVQVVEETRPKVQFEDGLGYGLFN